MPSTVPDAISYPDISQVQDQPAYMGTHAASVQTALNRRQRYNYVWSNATSRSAQIGMVAGSTGYQVDTKTEYKYENGSWRLATPHAEFTSTISNAASGSKPMTGTGSLDTSRSSSTNFVTASGDGQYTLTDAGVYAVSCFCEITNGGSFGTSIAYIQLSTQAGVGDAGRITRGGAIPGDDTITLGMPNLYVPAAGTNYYFTILQNSGSSKNFAFRIRFTRLG